MQQSEFNYALQNLYERFRVRPKYPNLVIGTFNTLRENITSLGGSRLKDLFTCIKEDNKLQLKLIIPSENWHFRFEIYHDVFRMLTKSLGNNVEYFENLKWDLECLEILPDNKGWGESFKSVLTV